jgi:glycine/D-amino acid oxidase-like deaminating enzyme
MNLESGFHNKKAIVIGGSMAGLLAARVLSDHFSHVVVLEGDDLSDEGTPRPGIPHGRHAHAPARGVRESSLTTIEPRPQASSDGF